jgi:FkbM family methyltransferase
MTSARSSALAAFGSASGSAREVAKTLSPAVARQKAGYRLDWMRFARGVHPVERDGLERLGSPYGGWVVPVDLIRPDWVCYSGGVGTDISFDLELIARHGVTVHAFDPTPRSAAFVEQAAPPEAFRFHGWGLADADGPQTFWLPRDAEHVSVSIDNLQHSEQSFVAECRTIPSVMAQLGHTRVDLLKLDIEGAEFGVLPSLLDAGVRPSVICAELHRRTDVGEMVALVDRVRAAGYDVVHLHRSDVTFVARAVL